MRRCPTSLFPSLAPPRPNIPMYSLYTQTRIPGSSPTPYIGLPSSDGYERGMNTGRFSENIDNRHRTAVCMATRRVRLTFENSAAQRSFSNSRKLLCRLIGASSADSFENHESSIIPANTSTWFINSMKTISCTRVAHSVNFINRRSTLCSRIKSIFGIRTISFILYLYQDVIRVII